MADSKLNSVRIAVLTAGGQKALAAKVGVTQQCVSKWCKSGRIPQKQVQKVAAATGFAPSFLAGYLEVLYEQNPESIGGALPGDDFYYVPQK